jgi:hypothetical protein
VLSLCAVTALPCHTVAVLHPPSPFISDVLCVGLCRPASCCWLQVADTPFARCSYTQGIELLQKAIKEGHKFDDMVRGCVSAARAWVASTTATTPAAPDAEQRTKLN